MAPQARSIAPAASAASGTALETAALSESAANVAAQHHDSAPRKSHDGARRGAADVPELKENIAPENRVPHHSQLDRHQKPIVAVIQEDKQSIAPQNEKESVAPQSVAPAEHQRALQSDNESISLQSRAPVEHQQGIAPQNDNERIVPQSQETSESRQKVAPQSDNDSIAPKSQALSESRQKVAPQSENDSIAPQSQALSESRQRVAEECEQVDTAPENHAPDVRRSTGTLGCPQWAEYAVVNCLPARGPPGPSDFCGAQFGPGQTQSLASGTSSMAPERFVDLTVKRMSGADLAVIQCSLDESVYEVKQRLGCVCFAAPGQQHLVFGQTVLPDQESLASCGILGGRAIVQFIQNSSSGISRVLESRRSDADQNKSLECTMADLCDSILQVEHRLSERQRPKAAYLEQAMSLRRRSELICWMMQAFDVLKFDDNILHSTTLTLDRYYVKQTMPIPDALLQRMLLAAICTEMKMANADEFPTLHWKRVVNHLCQNQIETEDILRQEAKMLRHLGFVVGVPTPVSFLKGLMVRVREATPKPEADRWENYAVFLLEIALFDAQLAYGFPHIALAAGALSAACRGCEAPAEQQEELLEDFSAYYPTLHQSDAADLVFECEWRLLTLWARCESGENAHVGPFYAAIRSKYSRNSRQAVAQMSPMDALRRHDVVVLAKKGAQ